MSSMLYVGGSETAFRCSCGANVFTKLSPFSYECNGCHFVYAADPYETPEDEGEANAQEDKGEQRDQLEAWQNWAFSAYYAAKCKHPELILKHLPKPDATYDELSACIDALHKDLEALGFPTALKA